MFSCGTVRRDQKKKESGIRISEELLTFLIDEMLQFFFVEMITMKMHFGMHLKLFKIPTIS